MLLKNGKLRTFSKAEPITSYFRNEFSLYNFWIQLIANEVKLQISLIVSVQNLTSKNYRYCKHITGQTPFELSAKIS